MVHVVLAGGGGNVGREILAELVDQKKHQITVLSRKDIPALSNTGIRVVKVDYTNHQDLTAALEGVHTVLSFLSDDAEATGQKALIAACVAAGVTRFAPSEWGITSESGFFAYKFKDDIHAHLQQLNATKPVLEYCLFQPGLFMNYLSFPHSSAQYLYSTCVGIDIEKGQAVMVEEGNEWQVFTTVQDTAKVVASAIDYEGKWPEIGGVVGSRIRARDVIKLAEKHTGRPIEVHVLKVADLEKGELKSTWRPPFGHPNMTEELKAKLALMVIPYFMLASTRGAVDVEPTWNKLLPDMRFKDVETFMGETYGAKS